jgi:SAM-dependent methyltransferase
MKPATSLQTSYDTFAWFYKKHWCSHYHPWAIAVLDRILVPRLAPGARVLDLCCGVGTITAALAARGCRVTGVDLSAEMLRFARREVQAEFVHADARHFRAPGEFDAAVSTFDSLNHILSPDDLLRVLGNVFVSLRPGGIFAFDVNLEESYRTGWKNTCTVVESDNAFFVRGGYDPEQRLGRTEITMFRLDGQWRRSDATMFQRCYPEKELESLLATAGFGSVEFYDVPRDLGIPGYPGAGRAFLLAERPIQELRV